MKLKDFYNQELDLTDPNDILSNDPAYKEWLDECDKLNEETSRAISSGKDSLESGSDE